MMPCWERGGKRKPGRGRAGDSSCRPPTMSYNGGDKRRRTGNGGGTGTATGSVTGGADDYNQVYVPQPSTSRTLARARQDKRQQEQQARQSQTRPRDDPPAVLDLTKLPPDALQRYLSRCESWIRAWGGGASAVPENTDCPMLFLPDGLLEPHGTLSYHHAVFPVPPLALHLQQPLDGRQLVTPPAPHAAAITDIAPTHDEHVATSQRQVDQVHDQVDRGDQPPAVTVVGAHARKRQWQQPHTPEFQHLTACTDPRVVNDRLAQRAKIHWDQRDGVKEGSVLDAHDRTKNETDAG